MDSDRKIAEDHVRWYINLLKSQLNAWVEITEKLMVENFVHGIKHGRELERNYGAKSGAQAGRETPIPEKIEK